MSSSTFTLFNNKPSIKIALTRKTYAWNYMELSGRLHEKGENWRIMNGMVSTSLRSHQNLAHTRLSTTSEIEIGGHTRRM